MKNFFPEGTKFNHKGFKWIAMKQSEKDWGNALYQKYQIWYCKKTWFTITCRYHVREERLTWEVSRFEPAKTRAQAAAKAACNTREALDAYVDLLARYGDEIERTQAKMILKKKGHINILEKSDAKTK